MKILVVAASLLMVTSVANARTSKKAVLKVTSSLFKEGGTMPNSTVFKGFGCTGDNLSPDLQWEGAPANTKSFAIIAHDPDAPTGVGWFHMTMANIPASITSLAAGAGSPGKTPEGALLGYTDFGSSEYGGPCPPPGKPHRYEFVVYALDVEKLEMLSAGSTGAMFRFMVSEHKLAEGKLTGKFGR